MEITATGIYWLMKCDAIGTFFMLVGVMFGITTIFLVMSIHDFDIGCGWSILSFVLSLVFFTAATLMPTTKQAAMICIAPKVLNSDVLRKDIPAEAKELYVLAKTWLQDKTKKEGSKE